MRQRRLKSEINVVPYIDVMLVLLVIFMVATPMMTTGSVDLPSAGATSGKPDKFIRVEIQDDGALSIDVDGKLSKLRDRKELADKLSQMKGADPEKPTPILIAGDQKTQYKNIIDILGDVRKLGFNRVGLETAGK